MDTISAFMMGEANKGRPLMVFDWDKAATLIKERGIQNASAGLAGDWNYTGGTILRDGNPVTDDYCYLASTWATPQLCLDDDETFINCHRPMDGSDWDESTKWPESALAILNR